MVGVQAVFNVLTGERYKIVPKEIKEYVRGLYGRPPVVIKDTIRRKILGSERPITERPADLLDPILPKVYAELDKSLVKKEEDYITYALFPEQALKFFDTREHPDKFFKEEKYEEKDMKQEDKEGLSLIRELLDLSSKHDLAELEWSFGEHKIKIIRESNHQPLMVEARPNNPSVTIMQPTVHAETKKASEVQSPAVEQPKNIIEIKSPMVGTFYSRSRPEAPQFVSKGDIVEAGQTLCIIEAMKLMNEIESERKGRIIDIKVKDGNTVEYGQILFLLEPL
jgi:oxaloacetate decarboxylase alpha subunit